MKVGTFATQEPWQLVSCSDSAAWRTDAGPLGDDAHSMGWLELAERAARRETPLQAEGSSDCNRPTTETVWVKMKSRQRRQAEEGKIAFSWSICSRESKIRWSSPLFFLYIVYLQTFSELSELFEFDGDALSDTSFTAWQLESSSVIPNFYYHCWWWRCNFYSDQPFLILSFLTYSTVISSISAFSHLEWPID